MKRALSAVDAPCKQRPPVSIGVYVDPFGLGFPLLLSPGRISRPKALLCLPPPPRGRRQENPGDTPLLLFALSLFALPLLLTIQKLLLLPELGERSHQLEAEPLQRKTRLFQGITPVKPDIMAVP